MVKSTCTAWTNTQRSRVYISEHSLQILSRLRVAFEIGKGVTDMKPNDNKISNNCLTKVITDQYEFKNDNKKINSYDNTVHSIKSCDSFSNRSKQSITYKLLYIKYRLVNKISDACHEDNFSSKTNCILFFFIDVNVCLLLTYEFEFPCRLSFIYP